MILQVPIPTEGSQTIKQASNKKLRGDNKYYDKNKTWWQTESDRVELLHIG